MLTVPVESADASVVRLGGALAGNLVSMLNVSRIEFLPVSPELQARIESGRPGLALAEGDFLEGTVRGIATNVVTMSSLLFGFRKFTAGSEAAVLEIGPVEPEEAGFRVRLRNGSDLRARQIEFGAGTLRAESPLLGALTIRAGEVAEVRREARER